MSITDPKNLVRMAHSGDLSMFMDIQTEISTGYMKHLNLRNVSYQDIDDIIEMLQEGIDIKFTRNRISELLELYPKVAIGINRNGLQDTGTNEEIYNMIADFYLNTDWPMYGDNLTNSEMEKFNQIVVDQINLVEAGL